MNQRTAKLLKKYAYTIKEDARAVKKWWETLDWKERTAWRVKIEAIVSDSSDSVEEVESVETTEA